MPYSEISCCPHAIGSGPPLSEGETRLVLAMKIGCFAQGFSGVRPMLINLMAEMFNRGILPVIPSQGSVGASGDLTPLAHVAAAIIGEGWVTVGSRVMPAADALANAGLEPLTLQPKKGMSLLNGTQVSTALAMAAALEAWQALDAAVAVGALTTEAVLGSAPSFDDRIHRQRRQPGQIEIARRIRGLIECSAFRSKALSEDRVEDPYCIRSQPQVYGACSPMPRRRSSARRTRSPTIRSSFPPVP